MVSVPVPMALATPDEVMEATERFADDHVTLLLMFWVPPSLYIAVAVSCSVLPLAIDELPGVTTIDTKDRWGRRVFPDGPPVDPAHPDKSKANRAMGRIWRQLPGPAKSWGRRVIARSNEHTGVRVWLFAQSPLFQFQVDTGRRVLAGPDSNNSM